MIMARLFHRIFFLLLLLTCHLALAQDGKWDQALDRYERICNRCIELRERAGRGENIPAESIADLLGQLGSLREMLQGAGSEMTPAQRARYEGIRRRYAEASGAPVLPSLPTLSKPSPELSGYRAKVPVLPPRLAGGGVAAGAVVRPHVPKRRNWGGNAILYGGLPDGYGGVFASLHSGRFGAYLKGSATIAPQAYSYTCFSDGTTPSGLIWTSGREALSRYAFSAGGSFAPLPHLRLYAGGGYGSRTVIWEDAAGEWAAVSDLSRKGAVVDGGIILSWWRLSLLAGVSTLDFQNFCAEIVAGLSF